MLIKYVKCVIFMVSILISPLANAVSGDINTQLNSYFSNLNKDLILNKKTKSSVSNNNPTRDGYNLTAMLTLAKQNWSTLSINNRRLISPFFIRPSSGSNLMTGLVGYQVSGNPETIINTTNFKIHYIDQAAFPTDINASTTSFATQVSVIAEDVLATEQLTLGYAAPPTDFLDPSGNGGDGLYDIYIMQLGSNYGLVTTDSVGTNDITRPNGSWTYMIIDNGFADLIFSNKTTLENIQVTLSHEYFHSIQIGYSTMEQISFMEQTSTWMEDIVYPLIHDNYQYIGEPYTDSNNNGQYDAGEVFVDNNVNLIRDSGSLDHPENELDAFNTLALIQYGRFLWPRYLSEKNNNLIIRTIWETASAIPGDSIFSSIDQILLAQGSSLAIAYQEYSAWGYDKMKFSNGINYPLVFVDSIISEGSTLSSSSTTSLSSLPLSQKHLSSIYIKSASVTAGSYDFTSGGNGLLAVTAITNDGTGVLTQTSVSIAAGAGTFTIPSGITELIFSISNVSSTLDGLTWSMTSNQAITSGVNTPVTPSGKIVPVGACSILPNAEFDPIMILMILFSAIYLVVKKHNKNI